MPKATTKESSRDARDYDTTQLHEAGHGRTLHRDYSAHFWRWSFARRFITAKHNVLEVGCGEDKPLSKILTGRAAAHVNHYTGFLTSNALPRFESSALATRIFAILAECTACMPACH